MSSNETPEFWKKIFSTNPSSKKQKRIGKKTETNRYYHVVIFNGEDNKRGEMGLLLNDFNCIPNELEKKIKDYPGTELIFQCFLIKEFDKGANMCYRPKVRQK